jgi:curved DNA-binding protein CbpA
MIGPLSQFDSSQGTCKRCFRWLSGRYHPDGGEAENAAPSGVQTVDTVRLGPSCITSGRKR